MNDAKYMLRFGGIEWIYTYFYGDEEGRRIIDRKL